LKELEDKGIEAFIPDNNYRKRDPRYAVAGVNYPVLSASTILTGVTGVE
jgi:hypothetical protein